MTGVIGLVDNGWRGASVPRGLGEDSLDVSAQESELVSSTSFGSSSSSSKPTARLSEEASIWVLRSGGKLLELRRGNSEGADIIDGEMEPGVLGEAGVDRDGESRAS